MFSCFLKCYPRSQEGAFSPFGTANLGTKKIPTQRLSELGIVIGILELLLEFCYDLMPSFTIKNSATTYCCL